MPAGLEYCKKRDIGNMYWEFPFCANFVQRVSSLGVPSCVIICICIIRKNGSNSEDTVDSQWIIFQSLIIIIGIQWNHLNRGLKLGCS